MLRLLRLSAALAAIAAATGCAKDEPPPNPDLKAPDIKPERTGRGAPKAR